MVQRDDGLKFDRFTLLAHDESMAHRVQTNAHSSEHRYNLACRILNSRQTRSEMFAEDIFDEPAWDILLSLYCAIGENGSITIKPLSLSVGAPWSNIDRWINLLIERDLVVRCDGAIPPESIVTLSRDGLVRLDAYFDQLLEKHFSGLI